MGDFPSLSVSLSDAVRGAVPHSKYTDTEAAAKIAADDLYVPRAEFDFVAARMFDAFVEDFSTRIRTESVELVIPSGWNTYDVEAWATVPVVVTEESTELFMLVSLDIEGTALNGTGGEQEMRRKAAGVQRQHVISVSGWAEGLSATGSRTVTLTMELESTSALITTSNRSIIAHAIRTS